MANLPSTDYPIVAKIWAEFHYVSQNATATMNVSDLQAAVSATDSWIDSNQSSFNNALPTTFKNTATLQEKTILFSYVAMRRAGLI